MRVLKLLLTKYRNCIKLLNIKQINQIYLNRGVKVDLNMEMREVLGDGGIAMSQNRLNMDRENQLIGQWKNVLKSAAATSNNNSRGAFLNPEQLNRCF